MNKIFDQLNRRQEMAVLHTEGPLRIIAGAGSGKTKVLTNKIAYLVETIGLDPKKIVAITFTNRAANEMLERVKSIIGDHAQQIQISTYHSLAVRILRQEINRVFDIPGNFNILDNVDQRQILAPIYKQLDVSSRVLSYNHLIDYISKAKMSFQTPEDMMKIAKSDGDKLRSRIYKQYLEVQKISHGLDFDDLLLYVLKIFQKDSTIRNKWRKMFDYVLVDEFQDTSNVQYEIIKVLSHRQNITIVGDPDQTIYSWRGADVELVLNFDKDFENTKTIKLEHNYRSTKNILNAANKLIRNNKKRLHKNLFSDSFEGELVRYQQLNSPDAEARWVVREIQNLQIQKIQIKDVAIFYRSNYLSKNLEQALILSNIPYRVFGSYRFFERQEIKDALAYLKIIIFDDIVSFKRMINIPSRKLGVIAIEKLEKYAQTKGKNLYETIKEHFQSLPLSSFQKQKIAHFMLLIEKHKKLLPTKKASTILTSFLTQVGYLDMWRNLDEHNKIDNLRELTRGLKRWEEENPKKTVENYLQEISLYNDNETFNKLSSSYVSLMTIHSAKGLEYDHVFVVGMSEGVFPSPRAIKENPEAIEEERRLAYVAMTRAKKSLCLVGSRGFTIDGETKKSPSRFLKEMGIKSSKIQFSKYSSVDYHKNYSEKNVYFVAGDKIIHNLFGKGIVVKVDDDTIDILFKKGVGVKTMMKNHNSILRR